jgi:UDP-3-O-[3-hydroxymyristoyl] N-acetylglucosamine deacetylase
MAQAIPSEILSVQSAVSQSQGTLRQAISLAGVGLHSGVDTQVTIHPAPVNTGRIFNRCDLPTPSPIPARVESVCQTLLSTELAAGDATVRTVEHLLAALVGAGVDNADIHVSGPELPLLDGSAQMWSAAIAAVGVEPQSATKPQWTVDTPIWVREQDAFVVAMPAAETRLTYGIDFDLPAIGNQWHSWSPATESFADTIAPARTFGLAHQIEYLQQQGLIKGGSLDNALVCDRDGWVNPPLRFENEPVRHKLLDLIGDLSLLGTLPIAHIMAYKASHHLHVQLANALLDHQRSS